CRGGPLRCRPPPRRPPRWSGAASGPAWKRSRKTRPRPAHRPPLPAGPHPPWSRAPRRIPQCSRAPRLRRPCKCAAAAQTPATPPGSPAPQSRRHRAMQITEPVSTFRGCTPCLTSPPGFHKAGRSATRKFRGTIGHAGHSLCIHLAPVKMERVRILLVEDETRVAGFIAKGLREQAYAVDIAGDGEQALYQAAVNQYDIVILDVMLPLKDGHTVCRELRASGFRTPILMLTARGAVDDRVEGLDSGADDYLAKPFDFKELLARLRALLRRPAALRPQVLRVADLTLNTASHAAARAGKPVSLT